TTSWTSRWRAARASCRCSTKSSIRGRSRPGNDALHPVEKFYPALSAEFARLLASLAGKKIAVIGHARPDGDCIGAQVALARVLAARGHDVICVNPDPVPRRLLFLVEGMTF